MPRSGRLVVTGYPHHVIQRGHNKQPVFLEDEDYSYYLSSLKDWRCEYGVKLYAYCLMTNHIHLLLEPSTSEGLGLLMKRLAGRQTRYFNAKYLRNGTLWDGRYKSSVVDSDAYLFNCARYIELNPVRAGIVPTPQDYRWSSFNEHIGNSHFSNVCDTLSGLSDPENYEAYVSEGIGDDELSFIRSSVNRNQLTGSASFISKIERITSIRVEHRGRGRPRKK
ncbi:transposase [Pontibacterium sp. N1Y112]|uniref:Transposase n=2 Tax=Pontibacterium sinense TaxID=2781979 RepID=A0A8J7K6C7_9GAMM|nr:transposase [Pontibacterium sinense]